MEVQVLGGLAALANGGNMCLGTPKQRAVFAVLALNHGQLVSVEQFVDELWPDGPPASAVANVRTYAARLRRALKTHTGDDLLRRLPGGYRLDLDPDQIDIVAFGREAERARQLTQRGELEPARELLYHAISRWRGPMLPGVPLGPHLTARVAAAEEARLLAVELLADVSIRTGRPGQAIPPLRELAAAHPLRESVQVRLVRALYRHGDPAEALDAVRAARRALREDLDLEPGPELQALHQEIERSRSSGPAVSPDRPLPPGATDPPVPSDRLPRSVSDFVGRREIVARLLAETERLDDEMSPVHFIDGMAGSGKTTLAVHVARRLASSFPDAQLFVDLRGHGAGPALDPPAALVVLLRQLGVPAERIPIDVEDRVELWRRELAARRAVVVLDNVADGEQVAPLLPTTRGSAFLVTSRRRLVDLSAGPPESLPPMSEAESVALLAASVGRARVEQEPDAAAELVRRCGYLPLAVRLAGARLAHRRTRRIADLAQQLSADRSLLPELRAGNKTVVGAFAASYEPLSPAAQELFRLLSVHPGQEFTVAMAAAISDESLPPTQEALDELIDGHLVEEGRGGRYRMHDLIRQYSGELSTERDNADRRDKALADLLDFVLYACLKAAAALEDGLSRVQVRATEPRRPDLLETVGGDAAWFEEERVTLVALAGRAHYARLHGAAWRLARTIWRFCYMRGYFDDIVVTHRAGLSAARAADDPAGTALMCNYLASAYVRTGNYREAMELLTTAVGICERTGDRSSLFRFRANLVVVFWLRGDLEQAVAVGVDAVRDPRGYGPREIPVGMPNLGLALATLGRFEEALRVHRLHLYWARIHRNYFHIANSLGHIGSVKARMGRHAAATRILRASLALRSRTGHRYAEAEVQNDLGVVLRNVGRLSESVRKCELALRLAVETGERHVQAAALNELGRTFAHLGDTAGSTEKFSAALALATRIGHPYEQGRALAGLAEHARTKDADEARRYWERALAIFRRMGVPERLEIERRLAELTNDPSPPR